MFSDEHDEQSYLSWFLLISIILHALFIWLWPQRPGAMITGVGLDQGGMVELVFVEGQPAIQPPAPPRPTPPVQDRPPRPEQTPEPEPEPASAAVVRTEEERVEPPQPSAPPVVEERPTPEPQPAPEPPPEPSSAPEPTPDPPAEPEPGVAEDILLGDQGEFEIPVTPEPVSESEPEPEAEPDLEPQPEPQPEPEPKPQTEPEPSTEPERQQEPALAEDDERAGESPAAEAGDEAVEGAPDGGPDGESAEPAAPPATLATRFGLGSPKAVEDVPLDEVLGEVQVEIHVRSDGTVDRVALLTSSGRELVDEALVGLMERWSFEATGSPYVEVWRVSFEPALQDGRTVWRPQPQFVERR